MLLLELQEEVEEDSQRHGLTVEDVESKMGRNSNSLVEDEELLLDELSLRMLRFPGTCSELELDEDEDELDDDEDEEDEGSWRR